MDDVMLDFPDAVSVTKNKCKHARLTPLIFEEPCGYHFLSTNRMAVQN